MGANRKGLSLNQEGKNACVFPGDPMHPNVPRSLEVHTAPARKSGPQPGSGPRDRQFSTVQPSEPACKTRQMGSFRQNTSGIPRCVHDWTLSSSKRVGVFSWRSDASQRPSKPRSQTPTWVWPQKTTSFPQSNLMSLEAKLEKWIRFVKTPPACHAAFITGTRSRAPEHVPRLTGSVRWDTMRP